MKSKTYFYRLKVISPLHVGCDKVYEPTGFVVDGDRKRLIAFDPTLFLGTLEADKLKKYSDICRKGTAESILEIYRFINQNKDIIQGGEVAVSSSFVEHYNKILELMHRDIQQELNKFLIDRTAFEPLFARPYIPGSAIKGALRTAILNLHNNGSNNPRFSGQYAGNDLQQHLLDYNNRKMETDPFRLIKVSDFQLIGKADRKIVYGVNKKKIPSDREAGGPPQIFEVVEPGAEFIGTITVQEPHTRAEIKKPVSMAEIEKSFSFYRREMAREKRELAAIGCKFDFPEKNPENNSRLLRVGRHCGAESVTVAGRRDIKIKGKKTKFLDHATTLWLAADSSKPNSNQGLRPFGWLYLAPLDDNERAEVKKSKLREFSSWQDSQQEKIENHRREIKNLIRRREEEKRERQIVAEEKRRIEEELKKYPWREFLPDFDRINDWGSLKSMVLEAEKVQQYQAEPEVGLAVAAVAVRVADRYRKKTWNRKRDEIVCQWLAASETGWDSQVHCAAPLKESASDADLLARISALKSFNDFRREKIQIRKIDKECAIALKNKFSQWGLKKNKKKAEKKEFDALVKRLKTLDC